MAYCLNYVTSALTKTCDTYLVKVTGTNSKNVTQLISGLAADAPRINVGKTALVTAGLLISQGLGLFGGQRQRKEEEVTQEARNDQVAAPIN